MAFIIILAALGVQWFVGFRFALSDLDWFGPYVGFLQKNLEKTGMWNGFAGLAFVVLPIVLIVALLDYMFHDAFGSVLSFLFSLLLLWYCLDARNPQLRLSAYFSGKKAEKEVKEFIGSALPKTEAGVARKVSSTLFHNALSNIFSMLFWFILVGPVGVATYYLVNLIADNRVKQSKPLADKAKLVLGVLDWVPVRLLGLSFALMGSFGSVFVYWMKNLLAGIDKAESLVVHYGLLANGASPSDSKSATYKECVEASGLCFRAIIVWLVLLAAITIASFF